MDPLDQALIDAMDADDLVAIDKTQRALDAADAATRARLAEPGALKAAALYYARRGWPVFPCKPGMKVPATTNGFKDATTNEDLIRYWWFAHDYNIGLPTGIAFDVVDIDGHIGMASLFDWCRETDTTSGTLFDRLGSVLTPRRPGTHIYIPPTGAGNKTAMGGIRPGIDYRGLGGYVLAPPSRTEHGTYIWATPVAA